MARLTTTMASEGTRFERRLRGRFKIRVIERRGRGNRHITSITTNITTRVIICHTHGFTTNNVWCMLTRIVVRLAIPAVVWRVLVGAARIIRGEGLLGLEFCLTLLVLHGEFCSFPSCSWLPRDNKIVASM